MATSDDYLRLRRMTGEVEDSTYTDTDLELFIRQAGSDLNAAASLIWGEKASTYADMVNISEAGSSRSNSDLFAHASQQQQYYNSISSAVISSTQTYSTTRPITRP